MQANAGEPAVRFGRCREMARRQRRARRRGVGMLGERCLRKPDGEDLHATLVIAHA
jgi:hypothetical protein